MNHSVIIYDGLDIYEEFTSSKMFYELKLEHEKRGLVLKFETSNLLIFDKGDTITKVKLYDIDSVLKMSKKNLFLYFSRYTFEKNKDFVESLMKMYDIPIDNAKLNKDNVFVFTIDKKECTVDYAKNMLTK